MVAQRKYEYGTSPRKLEPQIQTKTTKKRKKSVKVNKKAVLLHKIKLFSFVAIFFAIIFGISYRYSLINQKFNEIRKSKKEYIALQTANDQIEIGIQNKLDLTSIERYAKDKLGMQKPESNQIKYIDIEKEDKVELNDQVTIEKSVFENVWDGIVKLLD